MLSVDACGISADPNHHNNSNLDAAALPVDALRPPDDVMRLKPQSLVYGIFPATTAITGYALGLR